MKNEPDFDWSKWPIPEGIKDISDDVRDKKFDDFKGCFNDFTDTSAQPLFTSILLKEILKHESPSALDIGCGHGIGTKMEYQQLLASLCGTFHGVEPDKDIQIDPNVVQQVYRCFLEDAELPANYFDLAYAMFVVEHITNPKAFLQSIERSLKPGGCVVFLTTNGKSFFTIVAKWLKRLKLAEIVHSLLRKAQTLEVEHYPVVYRMNTPQQITKAAAEAGLCEPEFIYFQFDGTDRYMPGPFKPIYRTLMYIRRKRGKPATLDTLVCRIHKPDIN